MSNNHNNFSQINDPWLESEAEDHAELARRLYKSKKYIEALNEMNKAIALNSYESDFFARRGYISLMLDKNIDALNDFSEAIKIDDENPYFFLWRGLARKKLLDLQKSLDDFMLCKKMDQNMPTIDYNIQQVSFFIKNIDAIKTMNFEKSSIINFPEYQEFELISNSNIEEKAKNIFNEDNYSKKTKLNQIIDSPNWHIKTFKDFNNLIHDLKQIKQNSKYRTIEELIDLLLIIQEEDISLFIVQDQSKEEDPGLMAYYMEESNYIVLLRNHIFDIDGICQSLSHEIIHYLQKGRPLNLDIEDSVCIGYAGKYKDLTPEDFKRELESETFAYLPNFASKYHKNPNFIRKEFPLSQKRKSTIEWISKNRILPIYLSNSEPINKLDFSSS